MNNTTMIAKIFGVDCVGESFIQVCKFKLLPPDDESHYGTGYYMVVETSHEKHLVDVRYERTTDLEVLADRWIQNWYGENAKQVVKEFLS